MTQVAEWGAGPSDPRWFAVLTLPSKEAAALNHLRNQSFETYLPQRLKTVRHARRRTTRLAPLFPRYLFVRLDTARARWRSINGTFGVSHLVGFGDRPTPVPEGVVEALLEMSDENGRVELEAQLQPGQRVRIAAGPLADHIGTLTRADGPGAVRVLLQILGREVEVKARRDMVLPAA